MTSEPLGGEQEETDGNQVPATPVATEERETRDELVTLRHGDVLSDSEASDIARREDSTVVMFGGPVSSGKTTILTSLWDAFQNGPFANLIFAGSQTIMAFEQRCFESRSASFRSDPYTERTGRVDDDRFLHLRLREVGGDQNPFNILFPDLSGEFWEEAENSNEACERFGVLRSASHFALLLDGSKLKDPAGRHVVAAGARSLLQRLGERGVVGRECELSVVASKWDMIQQMEDGKRLACEKFTADLQAELLDRYGGIFRGCKSELVAARPKSEILPFAFGLDTLLAMWTKRLASRVELHSWKAPSDREFDLFESRTERSAR